ncbi:hypothetical protein H2199_006268 [Coniosporium tulheliwenetii]|uniref:Uncharacterized protein n=1 Tax=Coniosporium tulheliwenetii TaxID=3383036 RepID=A0ACC2YX83_9PEZI|nr:hypothetical protein H2199_006268 [Cladosporium sp. JES 115]
MDLRKLSVRSPVPANATMSDAGADAGLSNLIPGTVLEAFVPGYGLISRFILHAFGFDIGIVVSLGLVVFATATAIRYLKQWGKSIFFNYLTSDVHIEQEDDLFDNVLEWISQQQMAQTARTIKAATRPVEGSTSEGGNDQKHQQSSGNGGIFHYGQWEAQIPPRYEPHFGRVRFWHQGRLFFFTRYQKDNQRRSLHFSYGKAADEEGITLTCVGFSTKPIRRLLELIKMKSFEKQKSMTKIRRPSGKESRYGGAWYRISTRPSRPLETVALDKAQKEKIVADVNEYLHPASPRWYATRGIPYRRGYLFHGPPGTGKTSLSFALAGIFGLDIHVISLLDSTLTESDLNRLFNSLPRRCIVLLEDIDTAGLLRDEKSDEANADADKKSKDSTKKDDDAISAKDLANALKSAQRKAKEDDAKKGISLSGLLNAIDGVASHEGRVLVMTTNHPEKLDDALIRPGRVDMQVEFKLASHAQIREIFVRMYSREEDNDAEKYGAATATATLGTANGHGNANSSELKQRHGKHLPNGSIDIDIATSAFQDGFPPREELEQMAAEFASQIPEEQLSPADVQGFLLTRKKEPRRAVAEVAAWRDAKLEAKVKGTKVVRFS